MNLYSSEAFVHPFISNTAITNNRCVRKMYLQISPKVEYTLTPLSESLVPPLMKLYDWANAHLPEIKVSRVKVII